ncbi:MAG: 4-alpha-glucanotransferase [Mogibacterium sp.]|nr:4-alpha-glucanotransferase [Mogibacterium sp.]
MTIYHDSRDPSCRSPFGAVRTGTQITLTLHTEGLDPQNVRLVLRTGDNSMPRFINMTESRNDGRLSYSAVITAPAEGTLLWYYFALEVGDEDLRDTIYYGNNEDGLGGIGQIYHAEPAPYQITVYRESLTPSWYKDAIVYQIFPDRFARDEDWEERCKASVKEINSRPGGERRLIQEDWNRKAYYIRDDAGRVTGWPIYGGSLKGIEGKLDYLRSLGVTAIYLNPIFESTSNHHYDTADYMKIDPSLGTEEDFVSLTKTAREYGIRIFLDGVFSHTGADSKYFDRYGNYEPGTGAYANKDSEYRSWYKFDDNEPCGYKSWWGVDDLPEVNEEDPGFRELITGKDGVVSHWMKLGASGWRLDVADELPDSFIRDVTARVRATDPEGLVIGEVWEDASNKISYGERRRYFMGDELDGTMNYPLRQALMDYVNYTISGEYAGEILLSMKENYPSENFYGALNLIGSHDRERIITAMAAEEDYPSAVRKVVMLSTLQYSLPGVPCIYYGDEVGLTGDRDPENRNGYPWGHENLNLGYHYRMLGLIYNEHPVLKDGDFTMLSGKYGLSDDIFAFTRSGGTDNPDNETILVLANRSYGRTSVDLTHAGEIGGGYALELLSSKNLKITDKGFDKVLTMEPLSCMVICIRKEAPHIEDLGRRAGVICGISSLGKGVLGTPAKEFADYLASAGMKVWQVLPLNPTGLGDSPYSSRSAFAGNPDFINRDELPDSSGFEAFCKENMDWLSEYAAYTVIREEQEEKSWTVWPDEYRNADPAELLTSFKGKRAARADELVKDQYYFYVQWKELKEYANSLGIRMMGDLPIYMAGDSADVWANQNIFRLDENGRLKVHAGVPPDAFSEEGQDWGNPLYDWEYLKQTGYDWWMRRLRQCAERYDILRLDHFRGFSEYFAVPEGSKPTKGLWQHGPGLDFFRKIHEMLREYGLEMKILAEDLGFLDTGVTNLLKLSGLPGMDIWQFTADEMMEMSPEKAAIRAFYTGTHDNDTLMGFVLSNLAKGRAVDKELRTDAEILALHYIRQIYESPAALAMVQLQDMFLLGSEARINVPGIAEGNWKWRMPADTVQESFEDADERAAWFRELAEETGR